MTIINPQFYYIFLVIPSLFGITLIGEGIYKVSKEEWNGLVHIVFGLICLAFVIISYFMFTGLLAK